MGPKTVDDLFNRAITNPARPVITWYDDGTGERVELSGITLDNWVAKTANLLVDGCALSNGDRATVALPAHWQTAAVLLGCWRAGLQVDAGVAGTPQADPAQPSDVLFAAASRVGGPGHPPAGDRFVLGFAPLGAPMRQVPDGFVDYVAEVRGHGDRFVPYQVTQPTEPACPGRSHLELCTAATRRAADLGMAAGARVLIDTTAYPDPLDWLLAPLAAGASMVLCAAMPPTAADARISAERVTLSLTAMPE